ncbi:MAG: HAD family phosphatase [Bacteroidia bacterium]|nr:HAD family phosphatase [Bacteroidia bacterium]
MIRNVIFDLGNVLISFRPSDYLEKNNYPENKRKAILADIFRSKEWLSLDNGDISREKAIESIAARSSLSRHEIALIFDKRTDIMFPLADNVKIVPELKKQGFKLYYLSNFPADIFPEVKRIYSFFKHFDGGMISAEVRCSKPGARIYEILIERYGLIPKECLFIDDQEINVKSAEIAGFKGFCTEGSPGIGEEIQKLLSNHISCV